MNALIVEVCNNIFFRNVKDKQLIEKKRLFERKCVVSIVKKESNFNKIIFVS